jgi:capsular polysaccharide biosynthesis protein
MYEAEQVLSLKDLVQVLQRRLWVIVLTALLLAGLTLGYSWSQTPTYQASVKMVLISEIDNRAYGDLQSQVDGLQRFMPTVTEMAMTRPVAKNVAQRLDMSISPAAVLGGLSVEPGTETQFFYISYSDSNPERARLVANTVGEVLSEHVTKLNPGINTVEARIWEQAELPGSPTGQSPARLTLLALVFGLMLGAGLAFLLDYLDDGWKSPGEAEQVLGIPILGAVPSFEAQRKGRRKPSWRIGRT